MAFRIPNKADVSYARQAGGFSTDIDTVAAALAGDGVLTGMGAAAQSTPDMTIQVAAGQCRIGGYFPFYAGGNVTITTADSTNPRIDIICCDYNGTVSRTGGTAASLPVPPALPSNSVQIAQIYVPAGATSLTNDMVTDKRPVAVDYFDAYDEFDSMALVTTGNISKLSWGTTAATGGTMAFQAGVASHPGILRLVTGATSGNNQRIHLGSAANTAVLAPADIGRVRFMVRIPTITTLAIKCGLGVDLSVATAADLGTAGAFVEFVPATSAKWRYVTRQASTSTTNADTGADVVANNWYQFDIVRLQNGNWQFAKNMGLAFTHSANQPTTALNLGFLCHTLTTAARNLDIDFCGYNFGPLGNRWT